MKKINKLYILPSFFVIILILISLFANIFINKDNDLNLTDEEINWLKVHPTISIALDPAYAPFEFYEDGHYSGMSVDYLAWMSKELNVKFDMIYFDTWDELLQAVFDLKVDMSGSIVRTEDRIPHMLFTDYFYNNFDTILTNSNNKSITEAELINVKTGVIKNYSVAYWLKSKYPGIELVEVSNITEGLKLLSFGELDAFVTDFSQASYYIQKYGYQNIYAFEVSKIDTDGRLRFGVRKDYDILVTILNKALASMPSDFKSETQAKWIGVNLKPAFSKTTIYIIILAVFLLTSIVFIVLLINRLLKKEIEAKTKTIRTELEHIKSIESELLALNETLEEKVNERTVALEEMIVNLNETQAQMIQSEKLASLGSLVAGVAHEINTPLGVTLTASTYLEQINKSFNEKFNSSTLTKSELQKFIDSISNGTKIISDNVAKAATLVQSFKQLAVDQSNDSKKKFILKDNCSVVIASLHPKYDDSKITIENNISSNIILYSYPSAFSQIFTQLILNAIQHAFKIDSNGVIVIWCEESKDGISLKIADNGLGIADNIKNNIFDPFFTTKRNLGNSGLGMHIVYTIVSQKLKGNIGVEDFEPQGTLITINIPI